MERYKKEFKEVKKELQEAVVEKLDNWNVDQRKKVLAKTELIGVLKSKTLIRDLGDDYISIATGGAKSIVVEILGYLD